VYFSFSVLPEAQKLCKDLTVHICKLNLQSVNVPHNYSLTSTHGGFPLPHGDNFTGGVMKHLTIVAFILVFASVSAVAAVNGTKNVPGDYATLAEAMADINAQGVGEGGVIINLRSYTLPPMEESVRIPVGVAAVPKALDFDLQGDGNGSVSAILRTASGDAVTVTGFRSKEDAVRFIEASGVLGNTESDNK
jgi:hypothetical protein